MKRLLLTIAASAFILFVLGNPRKGNQEPTGISNTTAKTNINEGSEKLTKATFLQKIWDYANSPKEWKYLGSKPAIIDFDADWCGPCKMASPIIDEIGTEYTGKIVVYKINTDQERELSQVFGITGIPAFLYIPTTGKPFMTSGTGRTKEETKKMFIENIEKFLQVK